MHGVYAHNGEVSAYLNSIENAKSRGEILYGTRLEDPFCHVDNVRFTPMDSNTRKLGYVGKMVLHYMQQSRNPIRMLFLGPGAGRECFDAHNTVTQSGGTAHISIAALTPVAPDITPLLDVGVLLETDQYIHRQYIGDFADAQLVTESPFDFVYDQCGPMYHSNRGTTGGDIKQEKYATMFQNAYRLTSSGGCLIQECLPFPQKLIVWKENMNNNDALITNGYVAILIRDIRELFPHLEQCTHVNIYEWNAGNFKTKLTHLLSSLTQKMQ